MSQFPLFTHPQAQAHSVIAWRGATPISVRQFLADVAHLSARLPARTHMLNVCLDRYHFTVGLAAAIVSQKISLLPSTHTPETIRQLQLFAPDVFCLTDRDDCAIALPRCLYPAAALLDVDMVTEVFEVPQIDAAQLIAYVFTSGSTGAPLPHRKTWGALVRNVQAQARLCGFDDDRAHALLATVPPQHMYGLESSVLLPLQSGNALAAGGFFYPRDISDGLAALPAPRALISTPVHLRALLDAAIAVPELHAVLSATAPLSNCLAQRIEMELQTTLLEIYGSTETGQIALRRSAESADWTLFPGVELTQCDDQTTAAGAHVEQPTALQDVIELVDARHFRLHGRTADLVNIAGKRSSLAYLNAQLNAIEGVVDGAFVLPDERAEDGVTRLWALVVAPGCALEDLMQALRTRIDPVFLPRPLLLVERLPRNATGKLPRAELLASCRAVLARMRRDNDATKN